MIERLEYRQSSGGQFGGALRLAFSLAIGLVLLAGAAFFAFTAVLILLPLVFIAVVLGSWRLRKWQASVLRAQQSGRRPGQSPATIEVDYTVITGGRSPEVPVTASSNSRRSRRRAGLESDNIVSR